VTKLTEMANYRRPESEQDVPAALSVGSVIRLDAPGLRLTNAPFVLAWIIGEPDHVCAVSLANGAAWAKPVPVVNVESLTRAEVYKICSGKLYALDRWTYVCHISKWRGADA